MKEYLRQAKKRNLERNLPSTDSFNASIIRGGPKGQSKIKSSCEWQEPLTWATSSCFLWINRKLDGKQGSREVEVGLGLRASKHRIRMLEQQLNLLYLSDCPLPASSGPVKLLKVPSHCSLGQVSCQKFYANLSFLSDGFLDIFSPLSIFSLLFMESCCFFKFVV